MDKLKMHSPNKVDKNIELIGGLFPNCLVETKNENGIVKQAIDFDKLRQELSKDIVEGNKERYQFTWPDKKQAILLANSPIEKTLRPCREESVDFDHTENLYIEGDNLDVLKLLQETYLNKVKMIYIDPPYNTGNDFVYEDNFAQSTEEYIENSGQLDEEGNRLVQNNESNGRFHTDWLNMIYPRLKVAKDLLTEDGVIFISIDDHEVNNLVNICNEIFGHNNFVAQFPWRKRTAKSDVPYGISQDYEWIICYAKSASFQASIEGKKRKYFTTPDFPNKPWRIHDLTKQTTASERPNSFFTIVNPKNGKEYPANPNSTWRITKDSLKTYQSSQRIVFPGDYDFLKISKPQFRYWKEDDFKKDGANFGKAAVSTKLPDYIGMTSDGTKEIANLFDTKIFTFPKPTSILKFLQKIHTSNKDIILDFFSGSATTAHAVMQLNAEDKGNRKYIMVQLPEQTNEKSEAFKAGYKNICEIGKERIRRAGKKIVDELEEAKKDNKLFEEEEDNYKLDTGFRVLKLDSTNMKNVFYEPSEYTPELFSSLTDNIKEDRTPEDLLFQVMLELGVPLSHKIIKTTIKGKEVFNVNENYLIACFDDDVLDETVESIAKQKPMYAVFRDSSKSSDSVATNFEQLFKTFSPDTIRKVL